MSSEPINVLFVCLGNICRSPMAEAVFAHVVKQKQLDGNFGTIDSAGTSSFHVGENPDSRSASTCKDNGVPVNHRARRVTQDDFSKFDYVLCMDNSNLADLQEMKPAGSKATVKLFGDYDPQGETIIRDPYYGGNDGFQRNFKQVTRASEGLLKALGLI
ncbi:phosphotyrosine protein phosphatase I superfamily [Zychaea mexicana]|uniref:phosphotyrosine protein phosphatase I superfamily n=1 Tax=Zychaea mexicana TaxID=64656 RepID=UPI0022FDC97B|nr:phosphotyrosine protein phosphatase I superfamily [Zychaea mexicana]KAI9499305.1 phosphotyrosine protein phosphatase I superfamily [Zychaea mexicana]